MKADLLSASNGRVAAQEYGKTLFACVHIVDSEGNDYYSEVIAYSPEAYAAGRLEKSSNENLTELVKAMTIYGERASIYFK